MTSWLPQNVQKRAFQYLLNRLAVFSDLSLDNMDVSLGTSQKAVLTNVKLDPDRLDLPGGIYVRSGHIDELCVQIEVLGGGGIAISIDGLELTASVKAVDVEQATEHVEEFLQQTTADLAASILSEADTVDTDEMLDPAEEPPLLGMGGGGGLSEAVIKRVTGSVLSQLKVSITNAKIVLFLAADEKMEVRISSINLKPKGLREFGLDITGLRLMRPQTASVEAPSESSAPATGPTGYTSSDSDSDSDTYSDAKKSLMQSTIFSHAEASSIYMSAIASSEPGLLAPPAMDGILWVDSISLQLNILEGEEEGAGDRLAVACDVGTIRTSLSMFPTVLVSLVKLADTGKPKPSSRPSSEDSNASPNSLSFTLSISTIEACISALDTSSWQFVHPHNLLLAVKHVTIDLTEVQSLQLATVKLQRDTQTLFQFEDDITKDIMVKMSPSSLTVLMAKKATASFAVADLADILTLVKGISESFGELGKGSKKTKKAANDDTEISLQTNTFTINFTDDGTPLFTAYCLPFCISQSRLTTSRISITAGDAGVTVKDIALVLVPGEDDMVSNNIVPQTLLHVGSVDFDLSLAKAKELVEAFEPLKAVANIPSTKSAARPLARPPTAPMKLLRIVEEPPKPVITFAVVVDRVSGDLDVAGALKKLHTELGCLQVLVFPTRQSIEVGTIVVDRDLSDVGLETTQLIHPLKPEHNLLVEIEDGVPQLIIVKNCAIEFYTEILSLFGEDGDTHKSAIVSDDDTDEDEPEVSPPPTSAGVRLPIQVHDCCVGLNPMNSSAAGQFVVKHLTLEVKVGDSTSFTSFLGSARLLLIDDASKVEADIKDTLSSYLDQGYISVASLTAASVGISMEHGRIHIHINGDTVTLETCADSTQTLIQLVNGLKPPVEVSLASKFKVEPDGFLHTFDDVDELAFYTKSLKDQSQHSSTTTYQFDESETDMVPDDVPSIMSFVESYYGVDGVGVPSTNTTTKRKGRRRQPMAESYTRADFLLDEDLDNLVKKERVPGRHFPPEEIHFVDNHFEALDETAPELDDTFQADGSHEEAAHIVISVDLIHNVVWNFHDGYDWAYTRNEITGAVDGLKSRISKRADNQSSATPPPLTSDLLFNSIYIQAPASAEPEELDEALRKQIGAGGKRGSFSKSKKTAQLYRSARPLVQACLRGVVTQVSVFSGIDDEDVEEGAVLNSIDVKVKDFEVVDHVPTSTWNKFVTYMRSCGEREAGAVMAHISMQNVKPVPTLPSQEVILEVAVLPLRLHVDQDTLDFLTRFFSFKDARGAPPPEDEIPFIQKADIRAIPIKLDYKPKKVNYVGLRSGKTTEFMNFFILDEADMVLRRIVLHGISGYPDLGQRLNDIWMPDVRRTQLPGVLAGVAPVRPLVNLGGGFRNLIVVPVREYKKDGRVVRSLNQGAFAFAKTTTNELVKFGAKLAVGTQNWLEAAEGVLSNRDDEEKTGLPEEEEDTDVNHEGEVTRYYTYMGYSDDTNKLISLYANQPLGVYAGLQEAYSSFGRHMDVARNAIRDLGEEMSEADTAGAAAIAVVKAAPVAIIRPIIGTTEAVSKTLFGVTNQMDPSNRELTRDKYKYK